MKKFNFERLIDEKIAVHCKTQEEIDNFQMAVLTRGFKLYDYTPNNYYSFGYKHIKEPFDIFFIGIISNFKSYYEDNDYEIIEWNNYMEE